MSLTDVFETMSYGPAPESATIAQEWIDKHAPTFGLFIGGEWKAPVAGEDFEILNPSNGRHLAQVAQAGKEDVAAAVAAARAAQKEWQAIGGRARSKYLYAIARQIQKRSRLFAVLESMDNGKPIRETRDIDIPLVARHFYYHAGWARLMDRELQGYEPVGVAGQIIPWNFPLMMLAWKIAPAIAMGNAVVLKPAEFTPLTALLFAEICDLAGLPKGVVNIITGDGETGRLMVEHPDIDKIAFTGSTEVGRIIRKATAGTGKKLSLELGGKSPFIVFEDADLDSAVEGIVDAIWFNQGQVCCAGSRLLVQEGIEEKLIGKIRERMEKLRVGDPLDKAVDIGAIVAPVQLERIAQLVQQGHEEGADLHQPSWACPQEGWFYPPTLLTNVGPASTVAQVEIFGPVLVSMTFRTPKEAVELANNTPYGLAASVWSENINLALDISTKVKAGTVWINCTNQFDASSGFGGYRESGYGREGGAEGIWEYVKPVKSLVQPQEISTSVEIGESSEGLDRTHKQYVGGNQARPDSGYSLTIRLADGAAEEVARGNRKDVRNAVEAALGAQPAWGLSTAHNRAQILYYLAENLEAAEEQFVKALTKSGVPQPKEEFRDGVSQVLTYAALADKFEGAVHQVPMRGMAFTRNEPVGVIAIVCQPDRPLSALLATTCATIAMGNSVIVVPSEGLPLAAVELYRILDASDVPAGVVNILTGLHSEMDEVLAAHDGIDSIWHFGDREACRRAELASAGNLKQTWMGYGDSIDWNRIDPKILLRHATQVKNVWVPYGE